MRINLLSLTGVICASLTFIACNNESDKGTTTTTDTSTTTSITESTPAVAFDTAAAIAALPAHHRKGTKPTTTHKNAPKKVKNKMVVVDSDPPEVHDDAPDVIVLIPIPSQPAPAPAASHKDAEGAHYYPDTQASFPGGEKALDEYLLKHINYTQWAIQDEVEGVVNVYFTVDEKGKVTSVRTGKHVLGDGLDEEVKNVAKKMPNWTPATVNGQPVKSTFKVPVRFEIEPE